MKRQKPSRIPKNHRRPVNERERGPGAINTTMELDASDILEELTDDRVGMTV